MSEKWHEDDEFWEAYAPLMFNDQRWAMAAGEARRAADLLSVKPGDRILDSCCGVGRHAAELAGTGFRVTGVDRTAALLDAAKETAASYGLDIEYVLDDIRSFVRPHAFSGAINMFTSFGYFENEEEERTAIENVFRSLVPGSRFLIDLLGKEIIARDFKDNEWFEYDDMLVLTEYRILDGWTRLQNRWMIVRGSERIERTFSHTIYSADEISRLLLRSGFASVDVYGDLDRSPYDEKAARLVAVAHKE